MHVKSVTVMWGLFKAVSGSARHATMHTQITPLANWSDAEIYEWFGINLPRRLKVQKIFDRMTLNEVLLLEQRMKKMRNKDKKETLK